MEYVQMTLTDWVEMKQKLRRELLGIKQSFVRIGFMLRQIEEQKLYENDGYKSIAEFAKAEFGLEASTTSRFISINREYSVDGYSEVLSPEYAELGRSQLEEMLKLPEEDRCMVQPETSRQDIRDLKKFNKAEPEMGVADDLREVIENFYKDNEEILNAVFSENDLGTEKENIKSLAEIINPSGNRSYKKGLFFLIMYEDKIAVKKFGASPQEMTWEEFIGVTVDIFRDAAEGGNTWQRYFGQKGHDAKGQEELQKPGGEDSDGQQTPDEKGPARQQALGKENESQLVGKNIIENPVDGCSETEETAIAPAQKTPENTGPEEDSAEPEAGMDMEGIQERNREEDEIPGQMEITKDMPEYCPQFMNEPEEQESGKANQTAIAPAQKMPENTETEAGFLESENLEGIDRPYGTRKAYLDKQTEYTAALYIAESIKGMRNMTFTEMTDSGRWEKWLRTEVDDQGKEIDIVE
ncbi:hypothetical protein FMM80_14835 [Schaedlerella arabinosiphila]|uniref:DUF3102 domain-containing protein n=1 Tax=Schaedlerella arabinosiphila TaxID=2044587 RepID=A0A9X5H7B1_9FIRM|nr:hypothetical protein [Schaedlerella arabinosiphila]KAI4438806.1 hypothetical protein C824_001285 [Schaedlerella arabinosiphila]NDO69880.1 hypothetical protein [Schaedlerella arabinosiphila]